MCYVCGVRAAWSRTLYLCVSVTFTIRVSVQANGRWQQPLPLELAPQAGRDAHVHQLDVGVHLRLARSARDDGAHSGMAQRVLQRGGDERHAVAPAGGLEPAHVRADGVARRQVVVLGDCTAGRVGTAREDA